MMRSRQLIIALVIFSTPFCSPIEQTPKPITTTITIQIIMSRGSPSMLLKMPPTSSGVLPANSPPAIFTK